VEPRLPRSDNPRLGAGVNLRESGSFAARPQMTRFLIAPDSFKGTFTAPQVAAAIAAGIKAGGGVAARLPLADGGEGTAETLLAVRGGERRAAFVHDPLRRPLEAHFALLGEGETAVVDVAAASGLPLLEPAERDPERADSYGTGELIAAAIGAGARTVLVAAGGSATSDGGRGAIEALREHGGLNGAHLSVLCDVETRFEDAARVFGPQKGADDAAVARLTASLAELAAGLARDPRGVPMGGCAGGLSGGLYGAFGADLRPGAEFVLAAVGFDRALRRADAVVSGEGRIDRQSLEGKLVGTVTERCAAAGKPLHLVVGCDGFGAASAGLPIRSIREASTAEEMRRAGADLAAMSNSG
jgi:glycerate 2-kinase